MSFKIDMPLTTDLEKKVLEVVKSLKGLKVEDSKKILKKTLLRLDAHSVVE